MVFSVYWFVGSLVRWFWTSHFHASAASLTEDFVFVFIFFAERHSKATATGGDLRRKGYGLKSSLISRVWRYSGLVWTALFGLSWYRSILFGDFLLQDNGNKQSEESNTQ